MRYPEGRRSLNTKAGQNFLSILDAVDDNDFENIEEGDQLVVLSSSRGDHGVYEVTDIRDTHVVGNKLTRGGRLSKANGSRKRLNKSLFEKKTWGWETLFKFDCSTDSVLEAFDDYFEETKDEFVASGRSRDSQRQRVYDAERAMWKKLGKGTQFETANEANEWLVEFMYSDEFINEFPDFNRKGIRVKINNRYKDKCVASYGRGQIIVAGNSKYFGLNHAVICHELAHFTAKGAQHNAPFTTHLIKMFNIINEEMGIELQKQYTKRNVKF